MFGNSDSYLDWCQWAFEAPKTSCRVSCVFIFDNLSVCAVCLVAQSCPTLCDPMDCSPPGSSAQESSPAPQFESISFSAFFMVQLTSTHTTGKTIVLTIWTFIEKVMSLLINTLSRESQGWGILVGCRLWGRRVRHD